MNNPGSHLKSLISKQKVGHTLEQCFYIDSDIFRLDREKIVSHQWLLVDHVSRIPNVGDYFLFNIFDDEIIICRANDGTIHAHYNTCRHRGSRVCTEKQGNKRNFICPYHAWSYNLDGSLRKARLMPEDFDESSHGLYPCHIHIYEGLIFINLSTGTPLDFDAEYSCFQPHMDLHQLNRAKIADRKTWHLNCNWKLVVENFFECYHCIPSHPELSNVHSKAKYQAFGAGPGSAMGKAMEAFEPEFAAWKRKALSLGTLPEWVEDNEYSPTLKSASRLPINYKAGYASETKDGQPASTLMGNFQVFDGGTTGITFNLLSTLLMPNDYAMIFRFTPISAENTDVQIVWLVDRDAEEGTDYDKLNVRWLWYVTTQQDSDITEGNQAGIKSSRYMPGKYSEHEAAIATINRWYLRQLMTK